MEHVDIAKKASDRGDLERRLTGRFYTPLSIADRLADQALHACPQPSSIGDPFCGDGRLIIAWLRIASRSTALRGLRKVLLWDDDPAAVRLAQERVKAELAACGLSKVVTVIAEPGDTFALARFASHGIDTVLTNPPWELLKPDVRDGLVDESTYKTQLRAYAARLARDFPGAMSAKGKAMTGYGVNLARAGAVAAAMLTSANGAVAIVLPSSIFADQASAPFRLEFFKRVGVFRMDWYPAEARLFEGVDQSFVTAVAIAGVATSSYVLTRFGKDLGILEQRHTSISSDASKPIALNVAGVHESLVAELARRHGPLSLLEADMRFGLWLGRELDETRLLEALVDGAGGVPFLKGRNVFPFQVQRDNEIWRVDPKKRQIPNSVCETRLAWRDVSRPNQRRRMHVALVPRGNVTGNSLGVAFFRYGPPERIRVLMAIMNSLAFELQVRAHLSTAHVSQGVLRTCAVSLACFDDVSVRERLLALVDQRLAAGEESPELEVTIARSYGIARDDFASLLGAFPKLTPIETAAHLRSEYWS